MPILVLTKMKRENLGTAKLGPICKIPLKESVFNHAQCKKNVKGINVAMWELN